MLRIIKNKKLQYLIGGVITFVLIGIPVFAQTTSERIVPSRPSGGYTFGHLGDVLKNIEKIAEPIVASLGLILIVYGGYHMIMAGEDAEKFKTGKKIVLAVLIGVLIIFGAKMIITSITQGLNLESDYNKLKD
jgi:type IV secretory pathway VirB2 component (pilin)